MRIALVPSTALAGGLFLCLLVSTISALTGKECPQRNVTAARAVGRIRCHRSCTGPEDTSCKRNKVCLCAHECGYSCINKENYCGYPPSLPNVEYMKIERPWVNETRLPVLFPPYHFDDVVVYVCKPGFEISTKKMPMCHGRKKWTVGLTQCLRSCEDKNGAKVRAFNLQCGQTCTTDDDCMNNKTCLCDGACGRSCVDPDIDCGDAPPAANATIEYTGEKFQKVAHYICDEEFYLHSGSVSRKCTGGGTYDGSLAQCRRVVCGDPQPAIGATGGEIENYRAGPYYVGHNFTFRCPPSFRMLGEEVRTCLSNGRWSGIPTVCDSVDDIDDRCPNPGIPVNGFIMNGYNFGFGQIVQFGCHSGFAMVGEQRQECLFYRQWSGDGAPICVDPRYSDRSMDVIAKLQRRTASIKSRLRPRSDLGRHISAGHQGGHEIYFFVDVSQSVTSNEPELNSSLTFCIKLIDRLSANATGTIRYGLTLFASNVKVLVDPGKVFETAKELKKKIRSIVPDRNKLTKELGGATATYKALQSLDKQLALSFDRSRRNNDSDMERHFIFVTDGRHTEGPSPVDFIHNIILQYNDSAHLEFYSVTSCKDCQSAHTDAYKELLGLANGKQENFIRITDFYSINNRLDTITDARIDYSVCGKTGDTSSIRQQARRHIGRVLNGMRAADQSWTWQVLITKYGNNLALTYGNTQVVGGGSLINDKWVLTAAHVAKPKQKSVNGILLTFGMFSRPTRNTNELPPAVKVFTASKIYIPEEYNRDYHYDVALIRLKDELEFDSINAEWTPTGVTGSIRFTAQVRPVCLPCIPGNCVGELLKKSGVLTGNETHEERCQIEGDWLMEKDKPDNNKRVLAVVTGFGHVDPRDSGSPPPIPSPVLKQGLIRIRTDKHCNNSAKIIPWGGFKIPFTKTMSCATSGEQNNIVDSCQGDSGGPVSREVFDHRTKKSCWVQIGIVSWGWGCGQMLPQGGIMVQVPGYHTKVSAVMSWVNETMATEE